MRTADGPSLSSLCGTFPFTSKSLSGATGREKRWGRECVSEASEGPLLSVSYGWVICCVSWSPFYSSRHSGLLQSEERKSERRGSEGDGGM